MVSEIKKKQIQELIEKIKKYQLVGIVNFQNLPAQQLQIMRETLRTKGVEIIMTRKTLLRLALKESAISNVEGLIEKVRGMPALLLSNGNPFALYSIIQKNKSNAPIKGGQEATKDIIVNAGPTNFAPGPIISELASVGIKTKVDGGKLAIMGDTTVAKEGDVVSAKLAGLLTRLDIKPMEIGLNVIALWEDGFVFESKQLYINEQEYLDMITQAASWATNLAVESAYPTKETTEILIQKAFRDAKGLAVESAILNDVTSSEIISKAEREALSVKKESKFEL
jgi:large subunit ribosomal protein L10